MRWRAGDSREQSSAHESLAKGESSNDNTNSPNHELSSHYHQQHEMDYDDQDYSDHHRDDEDEDDVDDMTCLTECMSSNANQQTTSISNNNKSNPHHNSHHNDGLDTHSNNFTAPHRRQQQQSQTPSSSGSCLPSLPPSDTIPDLPSAPVASLTATTATSASNSSSSAANSSSSTTVATAAVVIEDEDDPGTDHALPLDDDSAALSHSPVWTPQTQQSTCEFTHTITQYSQKRESGCKKAEYSATTVDSFGNRWRLIVYVNGNGRASNHHLSLFLQVADADDLPFGWKKAVSYVLTLEHPSGPSLGYAKRNPDKTFKLCPKAIDWGWSQFITSDRIQQDGYISFDSLTVRAAVTVKSSSVSIDPEDAELYLKCAVEEGNAEAVEACLSQGAGVNCQFKDDLYTPLHTACSSSTSKGSLEVLRLLLKHGADCNACNKWRETPLLIAANNGYREAVEALLENGANPALCSEAGWSALTFAAHKGYDDIVSLLLAANAPVNCRVTEDLSSPLHKACAGNKTGHLSAVKQLIKAKADVHALNKWRETPLLTAANHGQASIVEVLLRAGSDPCKCTDTGWSPLSIAAYKGHDDVVRLLLEEGAPTEEADPTLSALLQAATKGLPETVELLLHHGADHTVTTKKGDTALSILVEQNLIDAAVEMVTEYKASVPRCSRDRKKVQRARLLINLRVKQQQNKEPSISINSDDDDDDSEQDEYDIGGNSALHDSGGSPTAIAPVSSKKKKRKAKAKIITDEKREADANAAAEALLLELEEEDAKAQKDEAAANSKRNKKKKKKERERQQKLNEEKMKLERERKEAEEREREKKIMQEKAKKEKAEKEKREREAKAKAEHEAMKMKENEERLRKQKEQEKKQREKLERQERKMSEASISRNSTRTISPNPYKKDKNPTKVKSTGAKKNASNLSPAKHTGNKDEVNNKNMSKTPVKGGKTTSTNKRGWETKQPKLKASAPTKQQQSQQLPQPQQQQHQQQLQQQPPPHHQKNPAEVLSQKVPTDVSVSFDHPANKNKEENVSLSENTMKFEEDQSNISYEDQLANMANGVVDYLGFDSPPNVLEKKVPVEAPMNPTLNLHQNKTYSYFSYGHVELPSVAIYQQQKLSELLSRFSAATNGASRPHSDRMSVVDEGIVKSVIYKWIVRSAHDTADFLDPVIPSWTDKERLIDFLQRQLMSETRRMMRNSQPILNIERLKDAGAYLADLCYNLAKDVSDFRAKCRQQVSNDWTDSSINITANEVMLEGGNTSVVVIDWAGQQACATSAVFVRLRDRYRVDPNQLLSAMFAVVKRYETMRTLVNGTTMDYRLSPHTLSILARELSVTMQLWVDPLTVNGSNSFCGMFPDVDLLFGSLQPFGKEETGGDTAILQHGGSIAVIPPLDSTSASLYMRRMLDLLEATENSGVALSFAVFLPLECFRELSMGPTVNDLRLLDPRLDSSHRMFTRCVEILAAGQHTYYCGDGDGRGELSQNGSLFVLLQNSLGMLRFSVDETSISNIINSVMIRRIPNNGLHPPSVSTTQGFSNHLFDPNHQFDQLQTTAGAQMPSHNNFNIDVAVNPFLSEQKNGPRRRGRLVELVDDGEDENNDVDTVSDIFNSMMFQNGSQDVDIEAISLMGIGGPPIGGNGNLHSQHGRFR